MFIPSVVRQTAAGVRSPWRPVSLPGVRDPQDRVERAPAAGSPAPPPPPPPHGVLKTVGKWTLVGVGAVAALGGSIYGGIAIYHGLTADNTPVVTEPVPAGTTLRHTANASDLAVLHALDGQLSYHGKSIDAFQAMTYLGRGEPVQIAVPRLGNHISTYVDDPQSQMTSDQVQQQQDKIVQPGVYAVTNFDDLERFNTAESLTQVDTSSALTPAEKTLVGQLSAFEGGVGGSSVQKQLAQNGQTWNYTAQQASPSLITYGHSSTFKPAERLTALQAAHLLQAGKPIVVRTANGLEQVLRTPEDLQQLRTLELPAVVGSDGPVKPGTLTPAQSSVLRQLANNHVLVAGEDGPDVQKGQTLSAFQVLKMLQAGKGVEVTVAPGLTTPVKGMDDLMRLNQEEGLTRIASATLSARDQQTASELQKFEGRDPNSSGQAAILGMRESWIHKGELVPSSTHLSVREARAMLAAGKPIAVRTVLGRVHVINSLQDLDNVALLEGDETPPPPPPPPPATDPGNGSTTQPDPNATQPAPDPNAGSTTGQ
ncbi:MAG: hypothetical protein ACYCW6_17485 [Candidatus Xenobia bacterium]